MADTAPVPLVSLFAEVDDPRRPQARLHALEDILLMATLAVICGADSWSEVELFGCQKQAWLETFLELPHGIPSHNTFGRVFARLEPHQLEGCFACWVQSLAAALQAQVVSVDGKVARRSHDAGRGVPALHLVGAWADAARLVLGQQRVDDHSNEITAIPELLRMLCLEGCIVTLDAMGCQKAIARQIREQEADYVLRVRANHQGLHDRMEDTFALERAADFSDYPHDYADTVGKDHGRIETRRCWTTGNPRLSRPCRSRPGVVRPDQPGLGRV